MSETSVEKIYQCQGLVYLGNPRSWGTCNQIMRVNETRRADGGVQVFCLPSDIGVLSCYVSKTWSWPYGNCNYCFTNTALVGNFTFLHCRRCFTKVKYSKFKPIV